MSFLIDPILLVILGTILRYSKKKLPKNVSTSRFLVILATIILCILYVMSPLLYLDYLGIPGIGKYGGGNHFMWNSGLELLGLDSIVDTSIPTYIHPIGLLNVLAITFFISYPFWLIFGWVIGDKFHKTASPLQCWEGEQL